MHKGHAMLKRDSVKHESKRLSLTFILSRRACGDKGDKFEAKR